MHVCLFTSSQRYTRFTHGAQDAEDRSIAVAIHQAIVCSVRLELLPKSTIDIFLTIVENDGIEGCVAAGSIAASTALANAGIDMVGLVVSCSGVSIFVPVLGPFDDNGLPVKSIVGTEVWLDPTQKEMQVSQGCLVLSCMPALGTVTSVWQSGQMKSQELLKVILQSDSFLSVI
jgi:exosome complex component MTR3